jgi:hypothetical protein
MAARRFTARAVRIGLTIAIGGNLVGAGGALYLLGDASDLTVDQALDRFRRSRTEASTLPTSGSTAPGGVSPSPSASPTAARSGAPASRPAASGPAAPGSSAPGTLSRDLEEGVYVYATEGYEETDALSGARHDYPSRTTMTVSRTGSSCYVWRWQPLDERWDESEACRRSSGIVLQRFSMYHEFFRRGIREDLTCGADSVVMSSEPKVGRRWTFTCRSDDTTIESKVSVVGFETLEIGGRSVRAVRMRYDTKMTGDNSGTHVQERWLADESGLLLRMTTDVNARVETPVGGSANYVERYRIDLTSTTPSR